MKKHVLCCAVAVGCTSVYGVHAQIHAFSVSDDIAMVRFNDPSGTQKGAVAKFSPDGRYFVVVTSRGILRSDQTESTLSIYRTDQCADFSSATAASVPLISIRIRAALMSHQITAYGSVITDPRWSADSQKLYFLGEGATGDRRIYLVHVNTGKAVPLTPRDYYVARFDFTKSEVVYSAWRSNKGEYSDGLDRNRDANPDARAVTGESIESILSPPQGLYIPRSRELWVARANTAHPVLVRVPAPALRDISWLSEAFSVSPSGRMLIQLRPMNDVPQGWEQYEPAKGEEFVRIRKDDPGIVAANNPTRLKEYSIVSLNDGVGATLVNAPQSLSLGYTGESKVIWSPDERRVLLTNTFLPLAGIDQEEQARRLRPCAIAEVQLSSREPHCIAFLGDSDPALAANIVANSIFFDKGDDHVTFTMKHSDGHEEKKTYAFVQGVWHLLSAVSPPQVHKLMQNSSLKVWVKQGLNEPPTLWATNVRTGQSKVIWNPNPQLTDMQFGEASVYRWKDSSGDEWKGGLVKPVGYVAGKRYPLVIQVYNFDETQFLSDGMMPTAFAARALASAGIVALQVQRRLPHTFSPAEADAQLRGIESAIDQLAKEGIVDSNKVGLVGFSFSCWYVESALIKSPGRFRAATIADGLDASYMQSHLWGVSNRSLEREFEAIIGSKPSGSGLANWFMLAPGFHLDGVATPVRIEAIAPVSLVGEWEIYSSLQMQGKPVDLIYFPFGQHIHQRPLERLESQQGDVDWFRFWLQGYEDPDSSKREQYLRWERMRPPDESSNEKLR
jgi:dipeptidyl aminopeptidase/acylaminoacyl peptidase